MNTTNCRPLRGSCECGRNIYIIQFPDAFSRDVVKVLFHDSPSHSTLLPAHLRVPLTWYHSVAVPFRPDETNSQIHRVYQSPDSSSMRHFCGFCGTPLSYWSERPQTEKDYIQLALGSLLPEDLGDLEELDLLPSSSEDDEGERTKEMLEFEKDERGKEEEEGVEENHGRVGVVSWLDSLVQGSRLGRLRMRRGAEVARGSRGKSVRIEWEVVEWTEEDDDGDGARAGKRKKGEVGDETGVGGGGFGVLG